jgi:hypothetical protein
MREFRTYGSVRGVRSNAHPYRDRKLLNSREIVMPGLVPGIHGAPPQRQCPLKSGLFPYPVKSKHQQEKSKWPL